MSATPQQPEKSATTSDAPVEFGLIRAHTFAALAALVISAIFGIIVSIKLHHPDFAGTEPWFTWGRLRYNHTQGIFFGWLGNAFLMFLYYAIPKLALRPVLNRHLGWCLFAIWNFAVVLPGWALVMLGFSQPLEWGEFPLIVDAFVVLAFIMSVAQFAIPLLRSKISMLYVSGWYILGSLVFTLLAYPVGNVVPELVPGAQGAAFSGLWIHDAIGLYVTPLAVSIAYFVIPMATRRPIYSHFLSMLGFWMLFFVYPLNGTHHFVFSAIPMDAQQGAIVASVFLGADVILVVTNLLLSLRGASKFIQEDISLRFIWMGIILYLIVSIQGSLQALMPVNKLLHFSDWVIGHSHLAMLGFASFIAIGGITHVWQRIPGVRFNHSLLKWSYWLLLGGMTAMVAILTVAGLIEAHIWESSLPWIDSVRDARLYWLLRTFSGLLVLSGFVLLWCSLTTGAVVAASAAAPGSAGVPSPGSAGVPPASDSSPASAGAPSPGSAGVPPASDSSPASALVPPASDSSARVVPWLNMAYLSASVAGIGFFLFSFGVLAVFPGMALEKEVARTKPITMLPPTDQEKQGRIVYAREGCAYCHTQQVRFLPADVQRFGAPTRAWETQYEYPHLWGTRRVGPDLARESGIRPDDWQLTHLYNPRLVVADSTMPGYPWLFQGSPAAPGPEAQALLSYLKSLGRARQLVGSDPTQWTLAPQCSCPDDVKKIETSPTSIEASSAAQRRSGTTLIVALPTDPTALATDVRRGAFLFSQNCASCHGATANGKGPASKTLLPQPSNLTDGHRTVANLSAAITNGVPGSAMPAWRDFPQRDVEALVAFVKSVEISDQASASSQNPAQIASGQKLFQANCVSCHGTKGDGNGAAAGALALCPTNFVEEQPSANDVLRVLAHGIAGTSMPPWKDQLSLTDQKAVTAYLRSLYRGN